MSYIQLTTSLDDLNKQCFYQFEKIKFNNIKFKQRINLNKLECVKDMKRIKSELNINKQKYFNNNDTIDKIDFNSPLQTMEYINAQIGDIMSRTSIKSKDIEYQKTFKLDINKTIMPDITHQIKLNSLDNSDIKLSKTPVTQTTKYYVAKTFPNMYNNVCKSNTHIQSTDPDYEVLDLKQFLDEYDESIYTKEITEKHNLELLFNKKHDAAKHKRLEKLLIDTPKMNRFAYTSMYCPIDHKAKRTTSSGLIKSNTDISFKLSSKRSVNFDFTSSEIDINLLEKENSIYKSKIPSKFDRRGSVMLKKKDIVVDGLPLEDSIETIETIEHISIRNQAPEEFYYILKDKVEKVGVDEKNKKVTIGQPFGYEHYRYNNVDNLDRVMDDLGKQNKLRSNPHSKSKHRNESFLPLGRSDQLIGSVLMNASDDAKKYSLVADDHQEEESQSILNPIMQMAKLNRLASMTYTDRKSTLSLINDPPKTPKNFPK